MQFIFAVISILTISLIATNLASSEQGNTFATFKLNGVETDCEIERLASSSFWGNSNVGSEGGAQLDDEEAKQAYQCTRSEMRVGYAKSANNAAIDYQNWSNFASSPYSSATHGTRYVNNYANAIAAPNYAKFEHGETFPIGSIIAKDSFVVNKNGRVIFGALSLMEKMSQGFDPQGGNWRYTLILPDGRQFGTTDGEGSVAVRFCRTCHQAVKTQDFLFFIPERYRIRR